MGDGVEGTKVHRAIKVLRTIMLLGAGPLGWLLLAFITYRDHVAAAALASEANAEAVPYDDIADDAQDTFEGLLENAPELLDPETLDSVVDAASELI